jgi:hypothetical protein
MARKHSGQAHTRKYHQQMHELEEKHDKVNVEDDKKTKNQTGEQLNNEVDHKELLEQNNKTMSLFKKDEQNSHTGQTLGNFINIGAVENKCSIEDKTKEELWSTKNRCLSHFEKFKDALKNQSSARDEPTVDKLEAAKLIALEFQINSAFKSNGIVQIIESLNGILKDDNTYESLNKTEKKGIVKHILDKKILDNHNLLYLIFKDTANNGLSNESGKLFDHLALGFELDENICDLLI